MEWGWLTALVSGPYLKGWPGWLLGLEARFLLLVRVKQIVKTTPKQPIADVNMIDIALCTTV